LYKSGQRFAKLFNGISFVNVSVKGRRGRRGQGKKGQEGVIKKGRRGQV